MVVKVTYMQQLALLCASALAMVVAAVAQAQAVALEGCDHTCGDVPVPYPFGIGNSSSKPDQTCFLDEAFELACGNSILTPANGNISILNIYIEQGELEVSTFVSSDCYNASSLETLGPIYSYFWVKSYDISSDKNKFYTVGCDSYGYLNNFQDDQNYSTGCLTRCNIEPNAENSKNCGGNGCFQVDIPLGMKNISIQAASFNRHQYVQHYNNCSYSFIHKLGENGDGYNFSTKDLEHLPFTETPMVLDWVVGNVECEVAMNSNNYACKNNSDCINSGNGYRCNCKTGYEGNPYLPEGCQDIDECEKSTHNCISIRNCRNINGSFEYFCKKRYTGKGTKEAGSHPENRLTKIVTIAGAGFIALLVGMSLVYLVYQKMKLIKLKEKFFRQNGGFILQQQLSKREHSPQNTTQI